MNIVMMITMILKVSVSVFANSIYFILYITDNIVFLLLEEKRCDARCKKSKLRCVLKENHDGRHKFTPPHLLSPSTINKMLLELTSGEIKSRAGLDNTDVIKGYENFQNMQSFLSTMAGIIQGDKAEKICQCLQQEIDWIEEFHKVDFLQHLGKGNSKCTCMRCGFCQKNRSYQVSI